MGPLMRQLTHLEVFTRTLEFLLGPITLGLAVMRNFDVYAERRWYWIGAAALLGFAILYNVSLHPFAYVL